MFISLNLSSQNKDDQISEIEKKVLKINEDLTLKAYKVPDTIRIKNNQEGEILVLKKKNRTIKIEFFCLNGEGLYESIKIYLQNKKPFFIEKESRTVIYARPTTPTNGAIETIYFLEKSKCYILNYDKNEFEYMIWNKVTNSYEYKKNDIFEVSFASAKFEINKILKLSEFTIMIKK